MRTKRFDITARLLPVAVFLLLAALLLASCGHEEEGPSATDPYAETAASDSKLAIIHTDIGGSLKAKKANGEAEDGAMGLAAVAALSRDYESSGYQVLILESGNAFVGGDASLFTEGEAVVDAMNLVGYDASGIGPDDFSWGTQRLSELAAQAKFPLLAANVVAPEGAEAFAQAHRIFSVGGVRVGVFGLCAPSIAQHYAPARLAGWTFLAGDELYACAQQEVDDLKEQGCDLIVCLGGLNDADGSPSTLMRDVVQHTKGIDLCIDGGDDDVGSQELNGTLVVEAGHGLSGIGVVLYENGVMRDNHIEFGAYDGIDASVADLVAQRERAVTEQLSEPFATTVCDLGGNAYPGVQNQETNLGDLVADSVLWQARQAHEADGVYVAASIVPGGCIAGSIAQGQISMGDVRTVLPDAHEVFTLEVTGAQLLAALEQACAAAPQASAEFPQVSNMTYGVDTTVAAQPDGSGGRVQIFDVAGQGFSPEATYTIATYEPVALGEGAYAAFAASAETARAIGSFDYQAMRNYIEQALEGTVGDGYRNAAGFIMVAVQEEEAQG